MDDIMLAVLFTGLAIGAIPVIGTLVDFIMDKVLR